MRRFLLIPLIIFMLLTTVSATEMTAPEPPKSAQELMPKESTTFGNDLWYIIKTALSKNNSDILSAARICFSIVAVAVFLCILCDYKGSAGTSVRLAGTICISVLLLSPSNTFIRLGVETVEGISEYGKLLMPVMTAALAAEGAGATSTALYSATMILNSVLTFAITKIMIPLIYGYIVLCIASAAFGESRLENIKGLIQWAITWVLKAGIYIFTGYLSITGVIGGTADAASLKAAKLAISGTVPVIGNIISDASETILVSAGVIKNAAGVYGMLAVISMLIGPFIKIGAQYLLLKATAGACGIFGCKNVINLVKDFSAVMGFVLAVIGTISVLLLISIVCYMKGVH